MNVFECEIAENLPKRGNHLAGSPAILKNNTASGEELA
jgi:hypothetical protein